MKDAPGSARFSRVGKREKLDVHLGCKDRSPLVIRPRGTGTFHPRLPRIVFDDIESRYAISLRKIPRNELNHSKKRRPSNHTFFTSNLLFSIQRNAPLSLLSIIFHNLFPSVILIKRSLSLSLFSYRRVISFHFRSND